MHIEPERSFVSQYPPSNFMTKKEIEDMWNPIPINLYVHIPYCVKKCGFCYYKSFPIANSQVPDEYIDALCQEIDLYANNASCPYSGTGTPQGQPQAVPAMQPLDLFPFPPAGLARNC